MQHQCFRLYSDDSPVVLESYIQDSSFIQESQVKRPALVICPGGYYAYHSQREGEPVALEFLRRGFQTFVLKYSVSSYQEEVGSKTQPTHFPQPMKDIATALDFILNHAEEWHIDSSKIGLCGFSAGGHNVATYGNAWQDKEITGHIQRPVEELRPVFNILAYPVTNYMTLIDQYPEKEAMSEDQLKMAQAFAYSCFGQLDPEEVLLEKWSPALTVNSNTPPTFIWATREDQLVPASQSLEMMLALDQAGIVYEGHLFGQGEHGLSLANEQSARKEDQLVESVEIWPDLATTWIHNLFDE